MRGLLKSGDSRKIKLINWRMIKGIIIFNKDGKPMLTKFYQTNIADDDQQRIIHGIFQQVIQRSDTFCNFLEGSIPQSIGATKIIYQHYASLYFVFAVDQQESELGILDLIQVIVDTLDKYFEIFCELDLIFHSDKVHYILDEIIMAGMILETNITDILLILNEQNKLHARSISKVLALQAKKALKNRNTNIIPNWDITLIPGV